jgi:hypothetical protein
MAYQRNPNDPFIDQRADDLRPNDTIEPIAPADTPPASGARMALYGVAVLALIGALFYGMSGTSNNTTAQNEPQNNMARNSTAPGAVRNVTPPRTNSEPGMTTGSAPVQTAPPVAPAAPAQSKTDAN